jgi:hypothetical protein
MIEEAYKVWWIKFWICTMIHHIEGSEAKHRTRHGATPRSKRRGQKSKERMEKLRNDRKDVDEIFTEMDVDKYLKDIAQYKLPLPVPYALPTTPIHF